MKQLSGRANAVLERYRAVESLREAEKGRLLDALKARAASGGVSRASVDLPPPPPAPSASFLEQVGRSAFVKAGIGVMGVAAAAALVGGAATRWRATMPDAPLRVAPADDPGTQNHARPDESAVDEEIRLLYHAEFSLRSGDARRAMALLDEHAAKFPWGKLSDEREVTRMGALCALGARAAAREKAEQFLARRPGSSLSDRVRRICTESNR